VTLDHSFSSFLGGGEMGVPARTRHTMVARYLPVGEARVRGRRGGREGGREAYTKSSTSLLVGEILDQSTEHFGAGPRSTLGGATTERS